MEKVNLKIKNIVSNNLQKKRKEKLIESVSTLNESSDFDSFVKRYKYISSKLISEGYTEKEILIQLNEFENPLEKIDWGGMAKESLYSGAREFAIKYILAALGLSDSLSTKLAQGLADYVKSPLDIIRMFKDKSSCMAGAPNVFDAVGEVVIRQLGGSVTKVNSNDYDWSGVGSTYVGNMFGEALRKSDFGETVADLFCKAIHK